MGGSRVRSFVFVTAIVVSGSLLFDYLWARPLNWERVAAFLVISMLNHCFLAAGEKSVS